MSDIALTQKPNWASYSHQELYDSVHTDNDPVQAGAIAGEWTGLAGEISDHAQRMSDAIKATTSSWQGKAGEAARQALNKLGEWSSQAAQTASALGQQVADQSQIMANARAAMPPPVVFDWKAELEDGFARGGLAGFAAAAADVRAKNEQANAAHEQAIAVMSAMEEQSRQLDQTTPQFSPPPNPIHMTTDQATPTKPGQRVRSAQGGQTTEKPLMTPQGTAGGMPADATAFLGSTGGPGVTGFAGGGSGTTSGMPALDSYTPAASGGDVGSPEAPALGDLPGLDGVSGGFGPGDSGTTGAGGTDAGGAGFSGGGFSAPSDIPNLDSYAPSSGQLFGPDSSGDLSERIPSTWDDGRSGDTTAQSFSPPLPLDGIPQGPVQDTFRMPSSFPDAPGASGTGFGPAGGGMPNSGSFTPPPFTIGGSTDGTTGGRTGTGGTAGGIGGPRGIGGTGGIGGPRGIGGGVSGLRGGTGGPGAPGETLARGSVTGAAGPSGEEPGQPGARPGVGASGTTGRAGQSAVTGMGAGAGAHGKREEDKERKSSPYVQGEDIFRAPGDDLPPPVIGVGRKKKDTKS